MHNVELWFDCNQELEIRVDKNCGRDGQGVEWDLTKIENQ